MSILSKNHILLVQWARNNAMTATTPVIDPQDLLDTLTAEQEKVKALREALVWAMRLVEVVNADDHGLDDASEWHDELLKVRTLLKETE